MRRPLALMACCSLTAPLALGQAPRATVAPEPAGSPTLRGGDVLDVEISNLYQPTEFGRIGAYPTGRAGFGVATESHNVGTVNVDWYSAGVTGQVLDNRHPFIAQSAFRIRDGRLEQIGLAWLKHGFYSLNDGCPDPEGNFLGVGCYDIYGASTNATRAWLGPRSEVDPLTGYWETCGSHFDTAAVGYPPDQPGDCIRSHFEAGHSVLQHRLRVYDADILESDDLRDVFFEAFYVVAGDENIWNNWMHRKFLAAYNSTTGKWDFTANAPIVQSPMIAVWGDTNEVALPDSEGAVLVASRVVALGGGLHRYEYNVYNLNLDRQIDSFSVALPSVGIAPMISAADFHAPLENEDIDYSTAAWTHAVEPGSITWTAPPADTMAGEEFPNTLRYGVMHTFWFTADREPDDAAATLTQFKTGIEGPLVATVRAPKCLLGAIDLNADGVVNTADLGLLIAAFGTSGPVGDLNNDLIVNTADLGLLIAAFGTACP